MLHPTIRLGLVFTCLYGPLFAQSSVVVTLHSVADRIRSQNPDLAAARLRIREAVARENQAGRLPNPSLETSFAHNPSFRERSFEIGFSQRFPVTDRLRLEKELSATALRSAEAEVREIERLLQADARSLVVKILSTRQRRELLRTQIDLSQKLAAFLSQASTQGEVSALDAGQAKLDAAGLDIQIRQLDAEETSLAGNLKPLLGMLPGEALSVSGTLPQPVLPPAHIDPSRRPDLQIARLEAHAAGQHVTLEQSRRYEDLEGGLFAGAERMEDAPNGYDTEAIIGLRLKIPLPLWNKNEAVIEEATARKARREMEATALARTIALDAEGAHADMKQWLSLIQEINTRLLPLAEEQSTLAETSYRNGQGDIQSVLRSREKHLELAAAHIDALREFHLARVRHETALAQP
jgi:cobalt-zinc-cadmium efflux system outer membrane protein